MKPLLSIVVPVYNGEKIIGDCIKSLQKQSIPKSKYEILIVDNNSKDSTNKIIRKHGIKPLFQKRPGAAAARNLGMKKAAGKYVVFTDADCIVHKDWLKKILEQFDKGADAVIGEMISYKPTTLSQRYIHFHRRPAKDIYNKTRKGAPAYARTANFAVTKKVIKKIGYFDENFKGAGGEDDDYSLRIHWAGFKTTIEPKAIIYHRDRETVKSLVRTTRTYSIAMCHLFSKHSDKLGRVYVRPSVFALPYYILACPFRMVAAKKGNRLFPLIDILKSWYKLTGRVKGSIKYRVLIL